MHAEIIDSVGAVTAAEWNCLQGTDYPFLRHEFMGALEHSGCVGPGTGWEPRHVLLRDEAGRLLAAMPLYRKTNSWGEFVFDWAWADAYQRAGLRYYPKLVAAIPFTPATSPRCLVAAGDTAQNSIRQLVAAALQYADETESSSLHVLFPTRGEAVELEHKGLMLRKDCQFHWHNQDYGDFDEFLGAFTSAKRKKVRRERRRVQEAGIRFEVLDGDDLDRVTWQEIMPLYASSFWRRGREPYLNQAFFVEIARQLPEQIVVILARLHGEAVAAAICFRSSDTLFGRYWGSAHRFHSLHFEACYYQGIEYCIDQGLSHFEPGTQGEHKISRGFVPTVTWSAHWLSHPQFAVAIDDYLDREREYIDEYITAVQEHVPYRKPSH